MIPRRFFWILDAFVLALAFLVAYALLPGWAVLFAPSALLRAPWLEEWLMPSTSAGTVPPIEVFLWIPLLMIPIGLLVLGLLGAHTTLLHQSRARILATSVSATLIGAGFLTLIQFALKSPETSRLLFFTYAVLAGLGLMAYRLILRRYFMMRRAAGYDVKNVLLIGLPSSVSWMAKYFSSYIPKREYTLCGYLSPVTTPGVERETLIPFLGTAPELGNLLIRRPIHEVIAILPTQDSGWLKQVIQDCDFLQVLLRIIPEGLLFGATRGLQTLYPFESLNLPAVVLAPINWDSDALFLKRLIDIVVAATLLVLLSPLFLLVAIAIKLTTPGLPIFYPWHVIGQQGKPFTGYKFTTMYPDADERKAELFAQNEMSGPVFKIKNDPRITPLGRFLRKFSINELPQLWSVLKGDMSLVGPRPAFRHELERYEFWHKRKLSIRPGITCLWQVRGRNQISDFDEWVKMDLEYIDDWSLWLDFKILLWTAKAVLAGTGS